MNYTRGLLTIILKNFNLISFPLKKSDLREIHRTLILQRALKQWFSKYNPLPAASVSSKTC